jgi:nucleolar protein 16
MGKTPRQRKKTKRISRKTAQKNKNAPKKQIASKPGIIQGMWDVKKTLLENYNDLGLIGTVNGSTGGDGLKGSKSAPASSGHDGHAHRQDEDDGHAHRDDSDREEDVYSHDADRDGEDEEYRALAIKQGKQLLEIGRKVGQRHNPTKKHSTKKSEMHSKLSHLQKVAKERTLLPQHEKGRHLSLQAMQNAKSLLDKYQDDYIAMSKDLKLNSLQKTPKQLEKMIGEWQRIQSTLDE